MWRITGYSSRIPFAPWISLAVLAISSAISTLFILASEICSLNHVPSSFFLPKWYASNCPLVISRSIHANLFWTSWYEAMGTSNWILESAYVLALWKQAIAAPNAPHEIPYLALLRQENGPRKPLTPGRIRSLGILQSWNTNSLVTEAFSECLPFISGAVKPSSPFSTMKPLMTPSSLAQTTATSAIVPLVIHIFAPLSKKWSPISSALVIMSPGFDP